MPYTPLQLAEAFIHSGELNAALAPLGQHLMTDPGDGDARRLRIKVLMHMPGADPLHAALADFEALAALDADDRIRRSIVLERLGEIQAAIDATSQPAEDAPDERLLERRLHLLITYDRAAQAQALLAAHGAHNWRWLQRAAEIASKLGDYAMALESYHAALENLEAHMDTARDANAAAMKAHILLGMAGAHEASEAYSEAEACYAQAARIIPDDAMIAFNRGLLAALGGDIERALDCCRGALAAANPTLRQHMADELHNDERFMALAKRLLAD